jgi:protein-tyrosine phosphatase
MKILMVCLGNICRSPLAEGILKAKFDELNKTVEIDSAGTGGWHIGSTPDVRSVKAAAKRQVDISMQKARKIQNADLDYYDFIFVMDKSNYADVKLLATSKEQEDKIHLILEFGNVGKGLEVPDPYYGTEKDFDDVFDLLDAACRDIAKKL